MSWEKHTLPELRKKLIELSILTEDEASDIKRRVGLVEKFHEAGHNYDTIFGDDSLAFDFDNSEPVDDVIDEVDKGEEAIARPMYGSLNWADYAMSCFTDDELVDGHPTLPGLRRVAKNLLGNIVFSAPTDVKVHFPQNMDEPGRCCVTHTLHIQFREDLTLGYIPEDALVRGDFPIRVFAAVGGAWHNNTSSPFDVYPEAMAENRAESRAYRKALMLNIVTHEELTDKDTANVIDKLRRQKERSITSEYNEDDVMADHQARVIEVMCDKFNIDLDKFLAHILEKDSKSKVTRKEATKLIYTLQLYQTNHEDSISIPQEILKNES